MAVIRPSVGGVTGGQGAFCNLQHPGNLSATVRDRRLSAETGAKGCPLFLHRQLTLLRLLPYGTGPAWLPGFWFWVLVLGSGFWVLGPGKKCTGCGLAMATVFAGRAAECHTNWIRYRSKRDNQVLGSRGLLFIRVKWLSELSCVVSWLSLGWFAPLRRFQFWETFLFFTKNTSSHRRPT